MKMMFNKLIELVVSPFRFDFDFDIRLRGDVLNEVWPGLFVGTRPKGADVVVLQEVGITHVVSCLREDDRA
ncbi:MAG TPA: hypothetical protein VLL52_18305, partial [Anaerolineae bacterium]|nr:hypothetical protein [Anaerolineae bacterium]